ncbi:MAG: hypothetical protein JXA69_10525 [Phycisphaerae bacterium]|nr:hypothetical protein [Phycisphaerae bacterium]
MRSSWIVVSFVLSLRFSAFAQEAATPAADAQTSQENTVVIKWPEGPPKTAEKTFTARFTPESLKALLLTRPELLPLPLQPMPERDAIAAALDRVAMGEVAEQMSGFLTQTFAQRFTASQDLIVSAVPPASQVTVDLSDVGLEPYQGPTSVVVGFVLHHITETEYVDVACRVFEVARQLVESGEPAFDRTSEQYLKVLAETEAQHLRTEKQKAMALAKQREETRKKIGTALGVYNAETGEFSGEPDWAKESRRFSYVVNAEAGKFIDLLQPLVDQINREMELADFPSPMPLQKPGIRFDKDLGDVEILLPRPMMRDFLAETDALEQRMAEKLIISIEAVRLTDRDIVEGALAARLNVDVQGAHDVKRFSTDAVMRQLGVNSLLAVANQQLQISTLEAIAAGQIPAGITPVQITPPAWPPIPFESSYTTVGSNFAVGADELFFRQGLTQSYGFSYVSPDGQVHNLGFDVVDSLRQLWTRIERNLIVHKIKKVPTLTKFNVPVGPDTKTFEGIAALISQEDQQLIVATGTGAISQISATAGTWLVIQDFNIAPTPGSSTALTEIEIETLHDRILLTMYLRDPRTDAEFKRSLLQTTTREQLHEMLFEHLDEIRSKPIREERAARTYGEVFAGRCGTAEEDAGTEKKEKNSIITLNFYSSQGNIVQSPGATQLGSANDLTSFTTELSPNQVTPISSFVIKSREDTRGSSPLLGVRKGESNAESKTMTHLLIRARFPTSERENSDRLEGRQLGYFELPIGKEPLSDVSVPFLSSSEHPLERLAAFRVGTMFDSLQENKVRNPLKLLDPNILEGTISPAVHKAAMTRLMLAARIIADGDGQDTTLAPRFRQRFITEVRSLLEYDPDFFDAPNAALQNLKHWNDPDRIRLALNSTPKRFALDRMILMLDELGQRLVPDTYATEYLAKTRYRLLAGHHLEPLSEEELQAVRRDTAIHYLRFCEAYGDAFMEGISTLLGLGSYREMKVGPYRKTTLRGYADLVVFDRSGKSMANQDEFEAARDKFQLLRDGGIKGGLFEPSYEVLEHMKSVDRHYVIRGSEVLNRS